MIVTTTMVREIRRRRAAGETLASIATATGLNEHTVWKYSSDRNIRTVTAIQELRWERTKQNPERLARRREAARRCMERKRAT